MFIFYFLLKGKKKGPKEKHDWEKIQNLNFTELTKKKKKNTQSKFHFRSLQHIFHHTNPWHFSNAWFFWVIKFESSCH